MGHSRRQPELQLKAGVARAGRVSRGLALRRALPVLLAGLFAAAAHAAPLTLDKAITLALENNQRVKVSSFSPQIARANVLTAYGAFDPALTFDRSYSETEVPGVLTPFTRRPLSQSDDYSLSLDGLAPWGMSYSLAGTASNFRGSATSRGFADNYTTFGGLRVTQPLLRGFGFGATLANLRIAKANRGISDWQHRQTVIDIVTNVIFAFNTLQQARDNLRIATLSRDGAGTLFNENEKKLKLGATSDAEVIQAHARVANREESVLIAERSLRDAENQIRLLIGDTAFRTAGPDLEIVTLAPATDITVDPAVDVKTAFDHRPDYQAARLGVAIDRASYSAAANALLPRLDFVGSYGYGGSSGDFRAARDQVRDQDARSYSAGMVVRVPLTFADGRGRARAAKLNLRQGEADLVRLEQDIKLSITAAAGQIETTRQRVAADKIAFELAERALENEQKRFKAGTSVTFFVLQQQEILSAAQNSYARALADQRRAQANYDRELGLTLERRGITLP
jgi:outer membrane protein